jgi:hypothetical protein
MNDPYLMLSLMSESWLSPTGRTADEADEDEEASGLQFGAYDSWPWRPAQPPQWPPRQPQPPSDCGMPPPCPMHVAFPQAAATPGAATRLPPVWTRTV